ACSYAHGPQELRPDVAAGGGSGSIMDGGASSMPMGSAPPNNPYYKTRMCQAFQQGLCQKGAYCNYAHGADEMAYYGGGVSGVLAGAGGDLPKGAVSANDIRLAEKRRFEKKRHHHNASSRSDYSSDSNSSSSEDETDRRIRELQQRLGLGHNGVNTLPGSNGPMGPPVAAGMGMMGQQVSIQAPAPRRYRTELCKHFMEGKCGYGEHCSYAHSMEEIRQHVAGNLPASSPIQTSIQQSNSMTGQPLAQPQFNIASSVSLLESARSDQSTKRSQLGHGHHHQKDKKLRTSSGAPAAVKICLDDL
ncbi:hypothetical protein Pmar_PMAR011353, partial [Perkinsus marinus ATCC 50983]